MRTYLLIAEVAQVVKSSASKHKVPGSFPGGELKLFQLRT